MTTKKQNDDKEPQKPKEQREELEYPEHEPGGVPKGDLFIDDQGILFLIGRRNETFWF